MRNLPILLLLAYIFPGLMALAQSDLIPRTILFGNPDRAGAQISPNGEKISYLAPVNGVMNLWVAPAADLAVAKPVTHDTGRGVRQYFWAQNNRHHLLYLQDSGGNENDHLYRADPDSGEVTDLTPINSAKAILILLSHRRPNEALIGLNDRNPGFYDAYRVNLTSGERELAYNNDQFATLIGDDDLQVRLGASFGQDTKLHLSRIAQDGSVSPLLTVPAEDAMSTQMLHVDKTGRFLYMLDSRGRDKAALTRLNLDNGQSEDIYVSRTADVVVGGLFHPIEKTPQAARVNYERAGFIAIDPSVRRDLEYLGKVTDGDITITSRSIDDKTWMVGYTRDLGGVSYYLYDRPQRKATFLFTAIKILEGGRLAQMRPVVIKSRDGMDLVSYLTLPVDSAAGRSIRPRTPLPMVLFVHGGPWARDIWGFNPMHQWLANRGYAVLSVNYRGSTGFGKSFVNAGNREWGRRMHDNLLDAVDWAIKSGIADSDKVAIAGASYGGYATLAGLTFTPDRFACGVDIVGPSNLVTLMKNVPPYWAPTLPTLKRRIGDPSTEEGRKFLLSRSPLTKADRISKPLLICLGANDPRVSRVEADQIAKAVKDHGQPVTYLLYPDEGHGFVRPQNNPSFFAVMEGFLAKAPRRPLRANRGCVQRLFNSDRRRWRRCLRPERCCRSEVIPFTQLL